MAISPFSLSRTGLADWLIQRFSASILFLYILCVFSFFLKHPSLSFSKWHAFLIQPTMQYFSLFALISLLSHAWIGIWTVLTDYVNCSYLRILLQFGLTAVLILELFWGIHIFWRL